MSTNDQLLPALRYLEVFVRGEAQGEVSVSTPDVARVFGQNKVIYYKMMSFQMVHNIYNVPDEADVASRTLTIRVPFFVPGPGMATYNAETKTASVDHPLGHIEWRPLNAVITPGSYNGHELAATIQDSLNGETWPPLGAIDYGQHWPLAPQPRDTFTVEYLDQFNKFSIQSTLYPIWLAVDSSLTWHSMGYQSPTHPIGLYIPELFFNAATKVYDTPSFHTFPDGTVDIDFTSYDTLYGGGAMVLLSDQQAVLNRIQFVAIDTSLQDVPLSANFRHELDPHIGIEETGSEDKADFLHATSTCEIIPFNVSFGQMLEYTAPGNAYARSCAPVSRVRVQVKPNKIDNFKFPQGSIWYAKFGFADQPF